MSEPVTIGRATLYLGDCREVLPTLPPVDFICADPPYGTTAAPWDNVIPFAEMWAAVGCVARAGTPILLFAAEPFASRLRLSNEAQFKHDWVWHKPKATGFLNAKKRPLVAHEVLCLFAEGQSRYFPQKTTGHERKTTFRSSKLQTDVYGHMAGDYHYDSTERYPRSVIEFRQDTQNSSEHATQKPVGLLAYFLRTYSLPGDTVLDFTMGSGTTGVACLQEGRDFIGIEKDPEIFASAVQRIQRANADLFAGAAA